jgi:hypothetical protein
MMRKTLMLGTLIALFGAAALAQAGDVAQTERNAAASNQPEASVIHNEGRHVHRHYSASHEDRHADRQSGRQHNDDSREHHNKHHDRHR